MENQKSIGFQLLGIRTEQFALVDQEFDTGKDLNVTVNFNVAKDDDQKIVSVLFLAKFLDDDKIIMIIECSCHFSIDDVSWNQFKENDSTALIIPQGFITHLALITVGTARGILHAKTEGTKFNGHILPTLNLLEIFLSDVRIE